MLNVSTPSLAEARSLGSGDGAERSRAGDGFDLDSLSKPDHVETERLSNLCTVRQPRSDARDTACIERDCSGPGTERVMRLQVFFRAGTSPVRCERLVSKCAEQLGEIRDPVKRIRPARTGFCVDARTGIAMVDSKLWQPRASICRRLMPGGRSRIHISFQATVENPSC